jgi:mannose-6-phosphate isomerase
MNRVEKPWGHELWFAQTDRYVGKILVIKEGQRLSLQYHKEKDETLYILDGMVRVTVNGKCTILIAGRAIHIPVLAEHRIEAITETSMIEVSTPEVDDVVRLEDDYGRVKDEVGSC